MPEIRRQWCNAMEAVVGVTFDEYNPGVPPDASADVIARAKKFERLLVKFAASARR
jgi:hypothetical protein